MLAFKDGGYTKGALYWVPRDKLLDLKERCSAPPVAGWHTHPLDGTPNSPFSPGDKGWAAEHDIPFYLRDQSGRDQVYVPPRRR